MNSEILRREAVCGTLGFLPAGLLARCSGKGVIIPYYHMISDQEVPHVKHLYPYKNEKDFTADLEFLLKHFRPVTLRDVIAAVLGGSPLPTRSFLLTFDDGFREMADVVVPILLKKGVPATFFVGSGFIDNKALCYDHQKSLIAESVNTGVSPVQSREINRLSGGRQGDSVDMVAVMAIDYARARILGRIAEVLSLDFDDYLTRHSPYLSSDSVRKMIEQGFAIGAHSIDHPLYSRIPLEEQIRQTLESVSHVRSRFGLGYGAFAFPHGDAGVSGAFFERIHAGGHVDISFGTDGLLEDAAPRNLQRVSFEKPLLDGERLLRLAVARKIYKTLRFRGRVRRG